MDLLDAIPEPYLIHCLQATRLLFIKMDRIVGPHWACLLVGFTLHQDRICNTFGASEALCIPFASSSTSPVPTCPLLISCPAGALVQGFCRTPLSPTPALPTFHVRLGTFLQGAFMTLQSTVASPRPALFHRGLFFFLEVLIVLIPMGSWLEACLLHWRVSSPKAGTVSVLLTSLCSVPSTGVFADC